MVSGRKIDKSEVFELFYGDLGTVPLVRDCPLCLECTLHRVVEFDTHDLFVGEIKAAWSEERYLKDGRPDVKKIDPLILTMPDNNYWRVGQHVGKAWSAGKKLKK